jgi:hypothetical protein
MKQKYLGDNERAIIKTLTENNNELQRQYLINWVRSELGKSFETISWTLKKMTKKGMIIYDPLTSTYTLPDHWREVLKQEKGVNALPQQLISINKRIELFRLAFENELIENEIEAYGIYGLLDIDMSSLKKVAEQYSNEKVRKDKETERTKKETSQLIAEYLNSSG